MTEIDKFDAMETWMGTNNKSKIGLQLFHLTPPPQDSDDDDDDDDECFFNIYWSQPWDKQVNNFCSTKSLMNKLLADYKRVFKADPSKFQEDSKLPPNTPARHFAFYPFPHLHWPPSDKEAKCAPFLISEFCDESI